MAKKKENLKDVGSAELEKNLATLGESLRVIRFKAEGSKSKNVKEASALKRKIAQAMTALNQKKQAVK
ncbi:MAG TPA: 50S ribosomal protein L29 [Candidatus Paceibacterota bacterium]|jgi:ribosomal protein L29|nr:50S ribosomal protein L29 [Candidatus Paceibacterota bacterium]